LAMLSCKEDNRRVEANNLNESAANFLEQKEYASAIMSAEKALKIHESISDSSGLAESLYLLARASALSGDFENARSYGEKGSGLCKITGNYPLEYKLNNILSWAYFTLGRDFNENLEHQKRQLFVVEQLRDDKAKAMVYNNYGYDATVSGSLSLDKAIDYMKFANDYYAKTENNNGRWYTLMNLTWQYRLKNDFVQSEKYGRLSVKQAEIDNDRHAIIEANSNMGETLLHQNKIKEAEPLYEKALEWSTQKEDRDKFVFDVYYSRYLWETGKGKEAISTLKNAINFLETSEIFYEMLARAFLSEYSYRLKDYEEAQEQIFVFKNPRANYISMESKVIAKTIEAQLLAIKDKNQAIEMLNKQYEELNESGATWLKEIISKVIENLKTDP